MRYLDGEAAPDEARSIEDELARSTELRRELALYRSLKHDLGELAIDLQVRVSVWDRVSLGIARPLGWVLVVVGLAVWGTYAAWLFATSTIAPIRKLAVSAMIVGLLVLFATVCWERYRAWHSDPYRDVQR